MSISNLIRGTLEARLGELRSEQERLRKASDRLAVVDAEIAEINALIANADSGKEATVVVAKRELPIARDREVVENPILPTNKPTGVK